MFNPSYYIFWFEISNAFQVRKIYHKATVRLIHIVNILKQLYFSCKISLVNDCKLRYSS